jgi:hypothetical protein
MKNIFRILILLLISLALEANAQQKPLPFLRDVTLKSNVEFNAPKGIYSYSYSIKNGASNTGELDDFEIDVRRDSLSTIVLDNIGLQFEDTLLEKWYMRKSTEVLKSTVPLSFPSLPPYGEATLTIRGTVRLMAKVIRQGQEVRGFVISSKGLPGIRKFIAIPYYDIVNYYPSIDDVDDPDSLMDKMERDRDSISFHGYTVGPIAPPVDFVEIAWCDTLLSYSQQSSSLGWIKDQRTEQRLDRKLERAKRLLQMADTWPPGSSAFLDETEKALKEDDNECSREYGQDAVREVPRLMLDEEKLMDLIRIGRESMQGSGKDKMKKPDENRRKEQYRDALYWAAKQVMESFVREVEILNKLSEKGLPAAAGKRQYLTSEAYALLKYNAEYLIDQLPGKERK